VNKSCILCNLKPPIENSHIVPRFALKRLKRNNPIGILIHSDKINKVEQDGWKMDYLCLDCEQRFSKLEDWFCKRLYDPFISGSINHFVYNDKLLEFSVSLYFRYLKFLIDYNIPQKNCTAILPIYEDFRNRLNNSDYIGLFSYLAFHREVINTGAGYIPGINTYFFECIDGGMFNWYFNPKEKFWIMYLKLPYLYFLWSGADLQRLFLENNDIHEISSLQILSSGTYKLLSNNSCLDHLVRDVFNQKASQIQNGYLIMDAKRLGNIKTKIKNTSNLSTFKAEHSYQLDMALLKKYNENQ
jgi:hypothetical protein